MVDYAKYYSPVLVKAVIICNNLIELLATIEDHDNKRIVSAIAGAERVRNDIEERMASGKYLSPTSFGSSNINGFMAFYDNNAGNDYGEALTKDNLIIRDQLLSEWIKQVVEPLIKLMNQLEEMKK